MPIIPTLCGYSRINVYYPFNLPVNESDLVNEIVDQAKDFLNLPNLIPILNKYTIWNYYSHPGGLSHQYGDEVIIINPDCAWTHEHQFGRPAVIGLLCHETGHVRNRYDLHNNLMLLYPGWEEEQRADFFAGYCLGKFDIDPSYLVNFLHVCNVMNHLYPPASQREYYVRKGFQTAELEDAYE